ncbi:MAG: diacylglycerol kinase family lipid kinase [Candidatus Poribacteria bacterium]|nr:diacylglycerol kinase family lipid kinase [Candidatus Poribacteria bacterium]
MNDFILIANPISGKGKAKSIAEQAHAALTRSALQGQMVFTSAAEDAKRFAREAVSDGIGFVIACGGDGTLHEVVNGIASIPDVVLGVLPCGRGNDFAAAIGIPLKPEAAIENLLSGTATRVDLGRCYQKSTIGGISESRAVETNSESRTEHYFTTIATCGYDAEVSRRAAKGTPLFTGTASYAYAAVETLFYYEPPSVHLEGEFGAYEGPLLLAATGITNRYGGGFKIVPNARIDDGLFDVCIIRPVSELTVLRLMVTLFWGGHVSHPAVSIHRTRTLTIETETPLLLYADGEPMCETPVTIEIIKGGLVVMSPR